MFKRNKIRQTTLIFLATSLLLIAIIGTVFANGPTTQMGWVGRVVIAQKDVTHSGTDWTGYMWSHTSDGNAIGTIGWTYWTRRELCNGSIYEQFLHDGYGTKYNSSSASISAVDSFSPCPGGARGGQVVGMHEFKNQGFADWHVDWFHTEPLQ